MASSQYLRGGRSTALTPRRRPYNRALTQLKNKLGGLMSPQPTQRQQLSNLARSLSDLMATNTR